MPLHLSQEYSKVFIKAAQGVQCESNDRDNIIDDDEEIDPQEAYQGQPLKQKIQYNLNTNINENIVGIS